MKEMKLIAALCFSLVLVSQSSRAHTELSQPAIGFVYLQDFPRERPAHRSLFGDIDPAPISNGVSFYGEMGTVPLIAYDYIQLDSIHLGEKRKHMAYVFEKQSNRFRIRTDENQFLWAQKNDTSGFVSFTDMLLDSCIYLDIVAAKKAKVALTPNDALESVSSWLEVTDERVFKVEEFQEIDAELWMRLSPMWFEPWHSKTNTKKTDKLFETSRWALAHDVDGLLAIEVFGTGANCD